MATSSSDLPVNPHLYALIACELSGDTLGAGLMRAIKRHDPQAQFIGIGGPKMARYGLQSEVPLESLSFMGIFEVAAHLFSLLSIRRNITKKLLKARPVVMIGIDAPDFNLHVEHRLKISGIKTIHYVSPSVWAWREGRMKKIKAACDEVLALLPFEKEFYDQHEMACTYVGHTLANSIPVEIDQNAARERIGLYKNSVEAIEGKVLAILPGSRRGIISRMLPLYARTAQLIRNQVKDITFISVAPNHDIAILIKDLWLQYAPEISLTVFVGNQEDAIAAADACLLTCGTIAFEAMLLKRPMVVAYKVSSLSALIARKLLKVNMYSLPNLLAKRQIVTELIQEDCTPEKMCYECIRLLTSDNLLMKREFASIHESIRTNADELACGVVLRLREQALQALPAVSAVGASAASAGADHSSTEDGSAAQGETTPKDAAVAALAEPRAATDASAVTDAATAATAAKAAKTGLSASEQAALSVTEIVEAAVYNDKLQQQRLAGISAKEEAHDVDDMKVVPLSAQVSGVGSSLGSCVGSGVDSGVAGITVASLNEQMVPLRQGLDDATIARLQQEVNGMEPALSLEEVLHLPNTEAKSSAASKNGAVKGKLKHLSLNSEDMNEADGLELGVRAKSSRRDKGAASKDKSGSKASGNAAKKSATTVRVTRGRSRNARKKGGSAGNSGGADTAI